MTTELRTDLSVEDHDRYVRGMEHLVRVVQELSLARTLTDVQRIVRTAARRLTGADGATFVMRDGDMCFYADEDAIEPLWKGSRFPLRSCISGWTMLNRKPAVIEDIYADDRIPHDVYRPTFVKSLAMVPIRAMDPVGAIGNYWAAKRQPTDSEVRLLSALADTTAVAIENVRVYTELEERVRARTAEVDAVNTTLREFVGVAAHDLRGPLTAIRGAAGLLPKAPPEQATKLTDIIDRQVGHMDRIIEDLMTLSLYDSGHLTVRAEDVDLRALAQLVGGEIDAPVLMDVPEELAIHGDPSHAKRIIGNLVRNADRHGGPPITVRASRLGSQVEIRVSDEGDGVPAEFEAKLFARFTRGQNSRSSDGGAGLGLSIVAALATANGGSVSYERNIPRGATFVVRLPAA